MAKSKAISPEVNGLFNKIEKQAEEYENAFNALNKFHRDSERIRRENEKLILQHNDLLVRNTELCERLEKIENYIDLRLQDVLAKCIEHLEVTVVGKAVEKTNAALKDFEGRAERAIGLIEGSTGIIKLVESLRELAKELDQKTLMIDDRISIIDNNIENKVKELNQKSEDLNKFKESFDILKSQIEELIAETNNKIVASIADSQHKFEAMLTNMFNDVSFTLEQRVKNTIVEVKNTQTVINQKIRRTDDRIDNFTSVAKKLELHLNELKESTHSVNKQMLDKLKLRVEEINNDLTQKIDKINGVIGSNKQFNVIEITDKKKNN